MKKRTYATLQEFMEKTGTTADRLARMARIDRTHLSKILSRSRRCSIEKALRLHEATDRTVPVENLIRWMRDDRMSLSERTVKTGGAEWS